MCRTASRRRRGATTSSSRGSAPRWRSSPTCRWARSAARYLCSATLARFEREGRQEADAPLMHWAIWDAMFKAQNAFEGVISNFPNRFLAKAMHCVVFPLGRPYVVPSDRLGHEVARLLIEPSAARDRLTAGMYLGAGHGEG